MTAGFTIKLFPREPVIALQKKMHGLFLLLKEHVSLKTKNAIIAVLEQGTRQHEGGSESNYAHKHGKEQHRVAWNTMAKYFMELPQEIARYVWFSFRQKTNSIKGLKSR